MTRFGILERRGHDRCGGEIALAAGLLLPFSVSLCLCGENSGLGVRNPTFCSFPFGFFQQRRRFRLFVITVQRVAT